MPSELYRTYEVLIEESVHPTHPKRGKTNKSNGYDAGIHESLKTTNELFQDDVCFYTIMLAGLAGKAEDANGRLLNPLWHEISSGKFKEQGQQIVRRFAERYPSCSGISGVEELFNRFLFKNEFAKENSGGDKHKMAADTYRVIEQQAVKTDEAGEIEESEALNVFASDWASILCDPENKTNVPGTGVLDEFHREALKDGANLDELLENAFSKASEWCKQSALEKQSQRLEAMKTSQTKAVEKAKTAAAKSKARQKWQEKIDAEVKDGQAAKEENEKNLENAVKTLKGALADGLRYDVQKHGVSENKYEQAEATLAKIAEEVSIATQGVNRIRYGSRDNSLEGVLLRYWWLHQRVETGSVEEQQLEIARAAVKRDLDIYLNDKAQKPKQPPVLNGSEVREAPFAAGFKCAFPLFLKGVADIKHKDRSPWWDFDRTAFMFAADDVFKYKRRSQERQARYQKLNCLVQLGGNEDGIRELKPKNSPTGKKLTVRGMKSDPRREAITSLLKEMAKERGLDGEYGLRPGTIGGWMDVRKAFLALERNAGKMNLKPQEDELIDAVDRCMEDNRQGFGDPNFFHELCEPTKQIIWSKAGEQTTQAKANGIVDFVPYYVRFMEWKEEVAGLQDLDAERKAKTDERGNICLLPISYTFPGLENRHGEISQRHFNFKAALGESLEFKTLFTKTEVDGKPVYSAVDSKEKRTVKLAARRLKRDKIITSGGESIKALWCPPLVLGIGQSPVAGKSKKGKASKKLEISYSLVVDVGQSEENWRTVHLKVQLPVAFSELNKTTRSEKKEWGGSMEWNKDGMGRFLRWPIDRLSKALATVGALKGHPTWENDENVVNALLARINTQTTNAQGKALAKEIEDAANSITDERSEQLVESASKALKGIGEKVWCQKQDENPCILSIDLGNRFCAAFARLQVHRDEKAEKKGRLISPDKDWPAKIYARVIERGVLRLQGEGAEVWDHVRDRDGKCVKDAQGKYVYAKEIEPFGNHGRGRFPKPEEKQRIEALADAILPLERTPIRALDTGTVPELTDHLLWRLRRRVSRIRSLFKLRWWIHPKSKKRDSKTGQYSLSFEDKERESHKAAVLEMLARSYTHPKKEEDEREDAVYESLRLKLATVKEWQDRFAEVVPEESKATKRKAKGKKKTKDVIRTLCASWQIPEPKWKSFLEHLEDELRMMLDVSKLSEVISTWKPMPSGEGQENWEMLKTAFESGKTRSESFNHALSATSFLLCVVTEWCLPVRQRRWHWKQDAKEPSLFMGKHGPKDEGFEAPEHLPPIQGRRGLALRRLEQVLNLRQVCQSFAKIERRWLQADNGVNDLVILRDEELHDPCPDLLTKSNELRDQRVFQTAHLILTEALALELRNPALVERDGKFKKELKTEIDLHGEYQAKKWNGQDVPRCSVIVLEDLSRYRTSQERTRAENSRLMQWSHRAIINKLADMARPFGITLMLVDPAWSSRFDSRTGVAGIRVKEVTSDFENDMPFAAWKKRVKANGGPDELARLVAEIKALFDANPGFNRTLVVPVEGGELFLPALPPEDNDEGLINADENGAVNVGLMALAHPDRLDIFPRLRTLKKGDGTVRVRNKRGHFASLPENDEARELRGDWNAPPAKNEDKPTGGDDLEGESEDSAAAESSEYPDFFAVIAGRTDFGVLCEEDKHTASSTTQKEIGNFVAYERPLFLKRVQQVCMNRIKDINTARIKAWETKDAKPDRDDEIPFT